jgi:tetratricopeptide (TPR) repeat protein
MRSNTKGLLRLGTAMAAMVIVSVTGSFAGEANAQQCISAQAEKNLSSCPGGKFQANLTKKPQVSFSTAPQGIEAKKRTTDLKPVNPTDITKTAQRDERAARLKPKVRKLLITEIANVERLYKSTPKNDKDRPQLMRRLAEGYVELESSAFREKVEAEVKAQQLRTKNPKRAAAFKKEAEKATQIIKTARKNAIKYYSSLKKSYPKWCQFPSNPPGEQSCIDEVLYYLAYEYEQAGELDKAREAYLELTENWKKSKFVPNAYLAFGELFFNEAQGDPSKWPVAANFYREVLKYNPPENKLWGYAAYKLGYVYWNQGEYGKSIDEFKKVIEFGKQYGSLPNATGLAKSARRDIIPVYALAGDPAKAYAFFKPLSEKNDDGSTYEMMEALGQNLLDTGHYPEAIILYKDLINRQPRGAKGCFYQAQITQATMALKSGVKDPIVKELQSQLDVYKTFMKAEHRGGDKLECANTTAALITETAMAWHLEAVGSGGVRGTGDEKTMDLSAKLYEMVVQNFTSDQFRQFKFPRIVKEDWPSISKIKYAMADLLYFQKNWEKCGPAFDSVVAEDPNGPNAAEAAFASVLCYQNIYALRHKDGSHRQGGGHLEESKETDATKFKPKEFTEEQKGMITAFNRYVCYIKPPEGDREALEQYVEVKYARARTYFEAYHWEEAAAAFRDIAINHPQMDASIYAANLYLEAVNVLGSKTQPQKPECLNMMEKDVPTFIGSFCGTEEKKKENDESCSVFFRIQRDIKRLQAEALVKACDSGQGLSKCEEAGNLYHALWKEYGQSACEAAKDAKDEKCKGNEEILYNAARAYQAARLIAKAIAIRKILIEPKYHLHETDPARKAVYEIGGNYQAIAVYDLAASWFEKFAEENPKMEKAPDALSDAVVLRLGLGQHAKAIEDAGNFNRRYGRDRAHAPKAAQIAFAIGAHYVERRDWDKARDALGRQAMTQIDQNATADIKIQAHALLGRVHNKTGNGRGADTEYAQVRDSWRDPAKMQKELDAIGGSQAQKDRRLGKVLTAVGEAFFHFAEKEKAKVDAMKVPEYKGKGERADVDKFVKNEIKTWMDKKGPAIEKAEVEYIKILELKPTPPPQWVIAAGASVGRMWGNFVAEFRAAPYPKEWDKDAFIPGSDAWEDGPVHFHELRSTYLASLDAASEPWRKRAKGAYLKCLDYSVKYQYFDEDSRTCEEWLSKNYPAEFHLIDEFRGAPSMANSGLDERPQPLNIDGTAFMEDTREAEEKAAQAQGGKKEDKK